MAGYGVGADLQAGELEALGSLGGALSEQYHVTADQRARFGRDGCLKVEGLLPPPLVELLAEAIRAHTYRENTRTAPLADRNTYDRAFIQVGGMWVHGGLARAFTFSPRIASCAVGLATRAATVIGTLQSCC